MYDKIYSAVQSVDDFVWGWWMIILLLGTHVFLFGNPRFSDVEDRIHTEKDNYEGNPSLCIKRGGS